MEDAIVRFKTFFFKNNIDSFVAFQLIFCTWQKTLNSQGKNCFDWGIFKLIDDWCFKWIGEKNDNTLPSNEGYLSSSIPTKLFLYLVQLLDFQDHLIETLFSILLEVPFLLLKINQKKEKIKKKNQFFLNIGFNPNFKRCILRRSEIFFQIFILSIFEIDWIQKPSYFQ